MQGNVQYPAGGREESDLYVAFAYFRSVNTPTMADVKLATNANLFSKFLKS